jgi:hypothetical protein
MGGWVFNATPLVALLVERTQYPLFRRLCGPQGQLGQVWNICPYWNLIHRWFSPYLHSLSINICYEKRKDLYE